MHYAAATRDGGHYMKILIKAGANSNALDNVFILIHFFWNITRTKKQPEEFSKLNKKN